MASFSVPCPKTAALFSAHPTEQGQLRNHRRSVSLQPNSKPNAALLVLQGSNWNQSNALKLHAHLTEVALEKSSNCAPVPNLKPDEPTKVPSSQNNVPDAESISTFMNQVTDLVKLVDSRDIVELQLKQMGCEILIKKKEDLPQTTVPNPVMTMHPAQAMNPAPPPPVQVARANAGPGPSPPVPATAPSTPAKPKSSNPVLKCPMAGTFYHSSAPGAPPFVKVGDKVQKGQVICIIEAMKLMNEIEADQSGIIVEILVDDAKPVSVDTPLFIIEL